MTKHAIYYNLPEVEKEKMSQKAHVVFIICCSNILWQMIVLGEYYCVARVIGIIIHVLFLD